MTASPVSPRTDRYMARVADHLATLPKTERLPFLRRERVKWIARSEEFAAKIDGGGEPSSDESIYDYTLTIMALSSRIAHEQKTEHFTSLVQTIRAAARP